MMPASAPVLSLAVQYAAADAPAPPARPRVRALVLAALRAARAARAEITVRFVDAQESAALNGKYRNAPRPTNVLSFDYGGAQEASEEAEVLGDIVICGEVVRQEALRYGKPAAARYAHMIVHGALHLAGYTHDAPAAAKKMETAERAILARCRIKEDPYQ